MIIAQPHDIVQFDPKISKDLDKLPIHVLNKLRFWVNSVNHNGISEIRRIPGFHDEPL